MNRHLSTRSRLLPLLVATALPAALVATPAPASAAAPASCQKGKAPWKLDGRAVCAAPARLGGATGPLGGALAETWLATASRPVPGSRVQLAAALRRAAPRAGRGLARLLDRASAAPAARAAQRGPVTDRIEKLASREQLDNGVVAESWVRGKAYEDGSTEFEGELQLRDRKGNAVRYTPNYGDMGAPETPVGCPTAAGAVHATTRGEMGGTVVRLRGRRVVGARTQHHTWQAQASGQVGTDARLESVRANVTMRFKISERGAGIQVSLDAPVSLRREGAPVLAGTPTVDVRIRAAGLSRAEERATEAEWARFVAGSPEFAHSIGTVAGVARKRLLEAEPGWYALPNDCAEIAWSPAAPLALQPGQTHEVTAAVMARRDRGTASGSIAVTEARRGRLTPTTPAFAPGSPARFTAAADGPDADGFTVHATPVATSTAGRAQAAWFATGTATPAAVRLPQSFRGTVSAASSGGGLTRRFSGSAAFTRTSVVHGPDGSITAWYELTSASLDRATETHGPTEGCRIEATAGGGTIDSGDLELRVLPGGAVVYALLYDLKAASTFAPTDCPPDHPGVPFDGDVSAFLNSGRPDAPDDRFRPAGDGYRIEAAGVTDVTAVPGGTTTASWSLLPE